MPTRSRGPYDTSPLPEQPRTFAERLRWLRKQRGLTQVEAAEALGCDQAMVSSWEVERTKPSAVTLGALARFYGVSPRALEHGDGFDRETKAPRGHLSEDQSSSEPSGHLEVKLDPVQPGRLLIVDAKSGRQEAIDAAEAMAALLRALKRGRRGWIVLG